MDSKYEVQENGSSPGYSVMLNYTATIIEKKNFFEREKAKRNGGLSIERPQQPVSGGPILAFFYNKKDAEEYAEFKNKQLDTQRVTIKLNITEDVLDKLGFSEYWDEHGTWGGRTLIFKDDTRFRIVEQCQMDDDTDGYGIDGTYQSDHYHFRGSFCDKSLKNMDDVDLFFLHELYDCIEKVYPHCLKEFKEKCIELKMGSYLKK